MKKFLAVVMTCALFATMLPSTVLADVADNAEEQTEDAAIVTEEPADELSSDTLSLDDGTYDIEISTDAVTDDITDVIESGDAEVTGDVVADEDESIDVVEDEEVTEEAEDMTFTAETNGIKVNVKAPAGALPDGAVLSAERYSEDSAKYKEAANAINYESTDETGMAAVDISFYVDGEKVEPTEPVEVSIDVSQILPSDTDKSTLEVQHLEETGGSINPVIVANESGAAGGTINEGTAVAEFEVGSFSTFTITWSNDVVPGTGATETSYKITFHPCDDEGSYIVDDMGTKFDDMNLTRTIGETIDVTTTMTFDGYTFETAYVEYGGVRYDNVTSVGIVTSGSDYVLQIVYEDGTYISDPLGGVGEENELEVDVYVVYTPNSSVTITVTGDESSGYLLTANAEHFSGTPDMEWTWNGSDSAVVTDNGDGTVSVNWDGATAGDSVTFKVTATYTTSDGTKQKATASYTLTYGTVPVTIQVYYTESSIGGPPTSTTVYPEGADVTLVDENGSIVATGTTGENGYITFDVLPGTYTVMADYEVKLSGGVTGEPDNYRGASYMSDPTEITVSDGMDTVVIEMLATSNTVDHIDIGINATATLYINGKELTASVGISEFDFESDGFEFYYSMDGGETYYDASGFMDMTTFEESTGQDGITQVRVDGSYPVGTKEDPYLYYMRITKDVTFTDTETGQEYTVSMTFFAEFYFWEEDNNCPGIGEEGSDNWNIWNDGGIPNEAGMDFILGASADDALLYIEKVVRDTNGNLIDATGETFTFDIYNNEYDEGTEPYDSVEMTLTSSGIGYIIAVVEPGSYYVVESEYQNSVNSQDYVGTYIETIADASQAEPGYEGTPVDSDGARTSEEETASSDASPIYIFTNVYESTVNILVEKEWDDNENEEGLRPESIDLQLTADGVPVEDETLTLPINGNWYGTFTNLPEFNSEGKEIEYSVEELPDYEGYTSSVGDLTYNEANNIYILTVTNELHTADASIDVQKVLNGREWTDDDSFTFTITADEGTPMPEETELTITADDSGSGYTKSFDPIEYTGAGTYIYTVTETKGDIGGIDYDENQITVTVTVTEEDETGELDVEVSYDGDAQAAVFTNTYSASGSIQLGGLKYVVGRSTYNPFVFSLYQANESFSYNSASDLISSASSSIPISEDSNGTFTFPSVSYSTAGTYYYVIKETSEGGSGWSVDSTEYHVVVEVADNNDGTLMVTGAYYVDENGNSVDLTEDNGVWGATGDNTIDFTNNYNAAGSVTLTATKDYAGAELTEGLFTFTIQENGGDYSATVTNDADGSITFPVIEYTLDDVGTHTYVITETNDSIGGVTYDGTEYTVVVDVEDNGDGTLKSIVTVNGDVMEDDNDTVFNVGTFENSYAATGSVTFGGEKTIEGTEGTSQTFEFALYTTDETFEIAEDAEATDTENVIGSGSFTFEAISYDSDTEGNGAGTYYYVVKETSTDANGWAMDTKEYRITVVVEDAGNGTYDLIVTAVDAEGQEVALEGTDANGVYSFSGLNFTNEYEPEPTSVQFTGSKYITNSSGTSKVFTFELYEADSSFTTSGEAIQTKSTTGADTITFDEITYDTAGTYYYVLQEQALDQTEGWTIDSTVYNITVEVTDDGLGQLVAAVTANGTEVDGNEDLYGGFDFTNAYAAEGNVTLGVVKSISSVASTEEEFEFTLYNSDADFNVGDSIETIKTDGEITNSTELTFKAIPYTEAGTYYYVIEETGTVPAGWTLDSTKYQVTVTVTDNGDGTLTTSASYATEDSEGAGNSANFVNTYEATGELNLTGIKNFTGGDLTADSFTFTMTDSNGNSVGDVTMDASGTITFPTLKYDETDIGETYTYTISEINAEDPGVQYDDTTYTVVVSVGDNKDGTLDITYTVNGTANGDITFTNYQKGGLIISKTFTGLTEDQIANLTNFTITVASSDGETEVSLNLSDATKEDDGVYTWTVSDLPAGTYTVTETGYSLDGYEVIAKSGDVEVTDGSDVSVADELDWGAEDEVDMTNDYTEVGSITISKYVVAEEDIQEGHKDTNYNVVITASEDMNFQWVTVTSSSGSEITPTIDGQTITFTITEYETVTISGLPAGEYTVEEQGSDAVTSDVFIPNYRIGDDDYENPPTVDVASGSENVVAVVIDNEYPIGTYITVQKEYNKDEYPEEGFTFKIEALSCDLEAKDVTLSADEMPMPNSDTVTLTEAGQTGLFTNFSYEHLGTYYYKITETAGSGENIDYDTSVHYIKVVVASSEGTHVETVDEWEAKAEEETEDYKDLTYSEAGIVKAEFTNTAYDKLTIEKEVAGEGDTSEYEFEITLTKDGTGYDGEIETADDVENTSLMTKVADLFSGIVKAFAGESDITFKDGKGSVTVKAGESVTLLIPSGWDCTVTEKTTGADSTTVYDGDGNVIVQAKGTKTEATAELGTIADSTQVKFVNSYRSYFPIDEEIVSDTDDIFNKNTWVKDEAVNEYNAIEIEMTTNLPVVTPYDLENGEFTMNFHNVLDHELVLDEDTTDFSVYIAGVQIASSYYKITFDEDTGDGCNFHVDVNLTALYNDGIVTEDMLDGNTEITIFFFADLEGTGLNGSYKSTIWYDIYDGDEWLYTSNESVIEVYTYEIEILKFDASILDETNYDECALAGATLGVFYDEECTIPISRNNEDYTVVSGDDGLAIFYGLVDGTYYVKEIEAPSGYVLSDEVLEVELDSDLDDHIYQSIYANEPESGSDQGGNTPGGSGGSNPSGTGSEVNNPSGTGSGSTNANPEQTKSSKTGDADLPILPICGCFAAAALIAGAVVIRRKKSM